jgi:hypothetical protein
MTWHPMTWRALFIGHYPGGTSVLIARAGDDAAPGVRWSWGTTRAAAAAKEGAGGLVLLRTCVAHWTPWARHAAPIRDHTAVISVSASL